MIWDLKLSKIHFVNIPWGTYRPCENTNSDVGTAEYSHLKAEGEHCLSQFHGWYRTNSQRRLERCRSYSDHDNILLPIVYSCFSPNNTVGERDRYIFQILFPFSVVVLVITWTQTYFCSPVNKSDYNE